MRANLATAWPAALTLPSHFNSIAKLTPIGIQDLAHKACTMGPESGCGGSLINAWAMKRVVMAPAKALLKQKNLKL